MRKFIVALLSFVSFAALGANTYSTNLVATNIFRIPSPNGGAYVAYVLLSSPDTNAASVNIYDAPSSSLSQITSAYYSTTTYASNYTTLWTNYYGATNSFTNVVLYSVSVTNAASTNTLTPKLILSTAAGASTIYNSLNVTFREGMLVTNTGAGTVGLTIGYVQ